MRQYTTPYGTTTINRFNRSAPIYYDSDRRNGLLLSLLHANNLSDSIVGAGGSVTSGGIRFKAVQVRDPMNNREVICTAPNRRNVNGSKVHSHDPAGAASDYLLGSPISIYRHKRGRIVREYTVGGTIKHYQYKKGFLKAQSEYRRNAGMNTYYRKAWNYLYDKSGNVTQTLYRARTAPNNWVTNISAATYDANDDLIASIDNKKRVMRFTYDANHNLIASVNPAGYSTGARYDTCGRVTREFDVMGKSTSHEYSADGRSHTITYPDGSKRIETYDAAMRLVVESESAPGLPSGLYTIRHQYDPLNRPTITTYPDGTTTENVYWPTNHMQIAATKDRAGNWTRFAYNAIGQQIAVSNAIGDQVTTICDAHSAIASINPLVRTNTIISRFMDSANRWYYSSKPKMTISAGGKSNFFVYTEFGRLARHYAPDVYQTRYVYDPFDRLVYTEILSPTPKYAANGSLQDYLYTNPPVYTVSNIYDAVGNLIGRREPIGVISNTFDPLLDRLTAKYGPRDIDRAHFEYDKAGNRVAASWPTLGLSLRYEYDTMSRLIAVYRINPNGASVKERTQGALICSYLYDAGGALREKLYANGVRAVYSYDHELRLTHLTHHLPGTNAALSYGYEYGTHRQIAAITRSDGYFASFKYDKSYRLISEHGSVANIEYFYDANGNRTNERAIRSIAMLHGNDNELLSKRALGTSSPSLDFVGMVTNRYKIEAVRLNKDSAQYGGSIVADGRPAGGVVFRVPNVPVSAGTNSYSITVTDTAAGALQQTSTSTHEFFSSNPMNIAAFDGVYHYDLRGQMTNRIENAAGNLYVYDRLGRLTEVHGSNFHRFYQYDTDSRRLQATEIDDCVTNVRLFVYDGMNVIAELCTSSGGTSTSTNVYVRGAELAGGIADIIAESSSQSSEIRYYSYNHRGDVVLVTDDRGDSRMQCEYTAFGSRVITSGIRTPASSTSLSFSTKEYDERTGLVYFGFRYYDPRLGRWLVFDPIGEGFNLYAYVNNNPINAIDFHGMLAMASGYTVHRRMGIQGEEYKTFQDAQLAKPEDKRREPNMYMDYNVADRDHQNDILKPWRGFTDYHLESDIGKIEANINNAINSGNREEFQLWGHAIADYYWHVEKGGITWSGYIYKWSTGGESLWALLSRHDEIEKENMSLKDILNDPYYKKGNERLMYYEGLWNEKNCPK
jgi:RHS repeat-associated protein